MAQSWNSEGIKFFFTTLIRPELIIPHFQIRDINCIDPERLKKSGIKGVIFDKDNTLTEYHSMEVHQNVADQLEKFREIFGYKGIAILSNSAGTLDDPGLKEAKLLEEKLGIPVIPHKKKKPAGGEEIAEYFNSDPNDLLMVGDRILTDIAFGNRYGMMTALVKPLNWKRDNKMAMICRPGENAYLWCLERSQFKYSVPNNVNFNRYLELSDKLKSC